MCGGMAGPGFPVRVDGDRGADVDRAGAAVDLGELVLGAGEADLESLDLAEPAFALGLGDAGQEVVADLGDAGPLGGVGASAYRIGADSDHTSLSECEPVIMAGHFSADTAGSITEFDNWAGHYRPQDEPGYTPLRQVARAAFVRFGLSKQIANAIWAPLSYGCGA